MWVCAWTATTLLTVCTVRADGLIREPLASIVATEMESTLAESEQSLRQGPLERDALVALLAERAIALHRLERLDALDAELAYLAAIEPDFRFNVSAPPKLVARWLRVRAATPRLSLGVQRERVQRGTRVSCTLRGEPAVPGLTVRIVHRLSGQSWQSRDAREVVVPPSPLSLEYYVEALGRGGAVLLREGSREAPLRGPALVSLTPEGAPAAGPSDERARRRMRWRWGTGAFVAAASVGAIVLAVMLGGRSTPKSQVSPEVDF